MKINKLKKDVKIKLSISIALVVILVLSFFFASKIERILGLTEKVRENQTTIDVIEKSDYYVSYLDVGQGNSTFIKLPDGKTALVDGGDVSYGLKVGEYLNNHGVEQIDYLIATHSDSDHIGGLNYILDHYEVKNILRPFQIAGTGTNSETFEVYSSEQLGEIYNKLNEDTNGKSKMSRVTTSVYKEFVDKIYKETYTEDEAVYQSTVTVFYDGLIISGDNYKFEFFAPLIRDNKYNLIDYTASTFGYATIGYGVNETNDNSAIFILECFDDYYLFTGDASFNSKEKGANGAEDDLLLSLTEEEYKLFSEIDIFLLGHHGSKHSSSEALLKAVMPKFVVVSSGHEYGHPADETLERVNGLSSLANDYLVRTDSFGTITFSSVDGIICYALEKTDIEIELMISWYELGSIIVVFCIILIFATRTNKSDGGM